MTSGVSRGDSGRACAEAGHLAAGVNTPARASGGTAKASRPRARRSTDSPSRHSLSPGFGDDARMVVIAWIGAALGLVVILSTLMSVVTSLVLPRLGSSRIQKYAGTGTIKVFSGISHRFDTYEERDRFLALQAPIYLIVILAIWLAALLIGFALTLWPFMKTGGFVHALTVSGSSLFTLGFATETGAAPRLIVFAAAAAGLWIVALQIAYLPVLYGAFNRREVLVTMLDSRAGSPAWGPNCWPAANWSIMSRT